MEIALLELKAGYLTEGRVVREEDRAQDGDGRNGRTEIASMKRESGMYSRLTIVCATVWCAIGTLREIGLLYFSKKRFQIRGKKFQM